jgi:peroxiredoxin
MVVFYRGHHCPLCKGYLGQLEGLIDEYKAAGVDVVAVSMNDRELAQKSKEEWGLAKTPVAFGLSEDTARAWDLYISTAIREGEATVFNEPGLFLVKPDGTLYMISIVSMPWGRPDLSELVGKIKFALEKNYPARGTKAA